MSKTTNSPIPLNLEALSPMFLAVGLFGVGVSAWKGNVLMGSLFASTCSAGAAICLTSGRNVQKYQEFQAIIGQKNHAIASLQTEVEQLHASQISQDREKQVLRQNLQFLQTTLNRTQEDLQNLRLVESCLEDSERRLKANFEAMQQERDRAFSDLEAYKIEVESAIAAETELRCAERLKDLRSNELLAIWNEADTVMNRFYELNRGLTAWGKQAFNRNEQHQHTLQQVAHVFNESIEQSVTTFDRERETLLKRIESLTEKIAVLQQETAGKLLEPELLDAGFDPARKAANEIALFIHRTAGIALRVFAVHESEGLYSVGFGVSKGADRHAIAQTIEGLSEPIARSLNIHAITDVSSSQILEGLKLSFRLLPAPPMKDDQVYRHMTKAAQFGATLRKYHNHKEGGKPTLRVMSASGGGKALAVKNLIESYVNCEKGYEIWVSDPKFGSDEDYWCIPRIARSRSEAQKLFKEFVAEYDARATKTSQHSRTKLLGIFDEFDKEHTEKDKDEAKRIWTAIRHHSMRMILIGQSGEVGANGWTWDEMNNCALLFLQDGIKTALKHYKDLGFSLKRKKELEHTYEAISGWMKERNESLDNAKKYRLGLLICGDHIEFLEVPAAIVGEIENNKSTLVSQKWQTESIESEIEKPEEIKATPVPHCPTCSHKLQSRGEKWMCVNPNHLTGKGQKSWKKDKFSGHL